MDVSQVSRSWSTRGESVEDMAAGPSPNLKDPRLLTNHDAVKISPTRALGAISSSPTILYSAACLLLMLNMNMIALRSECQSSPKRSLEKCDGSFVMTPPSV